MSTDMSTDKCGMAHATEDNHHSTTIDTPNFQASVTGSPKTITDSKMMVDLPPSTAFSSPTDASIPPSPLSASTSPSIAPPSFFYDPTAVPSPQSGNFPSSVSASPVEMKLPASVITSSCTQLGLGNKINGKALSDSIVEASIISLHSREEKEVVAILPLRPVGGLCVAATTARIRNILSLHEDHVKQLSPKMLESKFIKGKPLFELGEDGTFKAIQGSQKVPHSDSQYVICEREGRLRMWVGCGPHYTIAGQSKEPVIMAGNITFKGTSSLKIDYMDDESGTYHLASPKFPRFPPILAQLPKGKETLAMNELAQLQRLQEYEGLLTKYVKELDAHNKKIEELHTVQEFTLIYLGFPKDFKIRREHYDYNQLLEQIENQKNNICGLALEDGCS